MLKIRFNLTLDDSYKLARLFEILLEESVKFASNKQNNTIAFNMNFVLLLAEVGLILEERVCKRNTLRACSIG